MPSLSVIHFGDAAPGIARHRQGTGFRYVDSKGHTVRDNQTQARIRALAIPPAWTDVCISPRANSHLQATGRDARGRKQYRYHAAYRAHQEKQKFDHVIAFAQALPKIRRIVRRHMSRKGLPREKVLATVVHLLETTLIRVGNADYARQNKSYGLTTLRDPHVDIEGSELRFHFKGKSGRIWRLKITNRRVAKIVKACQDLPGQHLFQYYDPDGGLRHVTSGDVNMYLREITGQNVTAKDFRTWAGTVLAAAALQAFAAVDSHGAAKRNVRQAIENVASHLGNTATICRKCYVHPAILDSYMDGELVLRIKQCATAALHGDMQRLKPEEAAVLALLRARLKSGRRRVK